MEVIILMSWCIWTSRNYGLFNDIDPVADNCKRRFTSEFNLLLHKVKASSLSAITNWINSIWSAPPFVFFSLPFCLPFSPFLLSSLHFVRNLPIWWTFWALTDWATSPHFNNSWILIGPNKTGHVSRPLLLVVASPPRSLIWGAREALPPCPRYF